MNYSTHFQAPLGIQNMYSSYMNSFPQHNDLISAGMLQELWADDDDFRAPDPLKKFKGAYNNDLALSNSQTAFSTPLQINETIKSKNVPSTFNPSSINEFNYFDQRLSANHQPSPNLSIGLMNVPHKAYGLTPVENTQNAMANYQNAMANYQNQLGMAANQMQYNMALLREHSMRNGQMTTSSQSGAYYGANTQMNYLQYLQQQSRANNQTIDEKFLINHYNNLAKNHMQNMNAQLMQAAKQNMLENAQQEAQKLYENLMNSQSIQNLHNLQNIQNSQNQKVQEISQPKNTENFDEFPEISFDQFLPPEFYALAEASMHGGFISDDIKAKGLDDLDDKKTAETSASNQDEIIFKEFIMDGFADSSDMININEDMYEENYYKKSTPKKEEILLKKRRLDAIEKEEKSVNKPVNGKPINSKIVEKINKTSPKPKKVRAKDNSVVMEIFPKKRERGMNRLQSMRAAWDNYYEEQKKPYVIQLHVDQNDADQKVVNTRQGNNYQAQISPLENGFEMRPRRTRAMRALWDPSTIDSQKVEEFERVVAQIYGQEIKNQEAVLKILRGTGMDVDSTIENIANNKMYFKGILFPEPKPVKAQRNL